MSGDYGDRTSLQRVELRALLASRLGDPNVSIVVSALRRYRYAVDKALRERHLDGEIDAVSANALAIEMADIESME